MSKNDIEVGSRVIAFQYLESSKREVGLIGYGTYTGDCDVPSHYSSILPPNAMCQPRIELDDGTVVWGFECWWGVEDNVKEHQLLNDPATKIVYVDVVRERVERLLAESPQAVPTAKFKEEAPAVGLMDYLKPQHSLIKFTSKYFGASCK